MSYIVPDKLPTSCCGCHMFMHEEHDLYSIANHYAGYCRELCKYINEDAFVNERHPDCPFIEVKTPHGRLIDADALRVLFADWYRVLDDNMREEVALRYIDDAPTVIEAEEKND